MFVLHEVMVMNVGSGVDQSPRAFHADRYGLLRTMAA